MERELAKCNSFDFGIEDHGCPVLFGYFHYESGDAQGLGYQVDTAFLMRFLEVFGVERLSEVKGKSCWVTCNDRHISKIEPLHAKEGTPFDIDKWCAEKDKDPGPSAYELRTGRKP